MKPGEKIKDEDKWGVEDLSRMKSFCVSCGDPLTPDARRFRMTGNYCHKCSVQCDKNRDHKIITVKPDAS